MFPESILSSTVGGTFSHMCYSTTACI